MSLSRWESTERNPDYTQKRRSKSSGLVFDRDVGCPVMLAFLLVGLIATGAGLFTVAYWTMEWPKSVAVGAGGVVIFVASLGGFIVFWYTMDRYHYRPEEVEEYWKDIEVEEPAPYSVRVTPNTSRIGRYKWTTLQWQHIAERCWYKGEWAAGARMTRSQFAGIVKDLNKQYPIIVQDFIDWGFIDTNNNWLEDGRIGIKEHLI